MVGRRLRVDSTNDSTNTKSKSSKLIFRTMIDGVNEDAIQPRQIIRYNSWWWFRQLLTRIIVCMMGGNIWMKTSNLIVLCICERLKLEIQIKTKSNQRKNKVNRDAAIKDPRQLIQIQTMDLADWLWYQVKQQRISPNWSYSFH